MCDVTSQLVRSVDSCLGSIDVMRGLSTPPRAPPGLATMSVSQATLPAASAGALTSAAAARASAPSSSSVLDGLEQLPPDIQPIATETLDSDSVMSRTDSPVNHDAARHAHIKLSLWLQCTLPKVLVTFYANAGDAAGSGMSRVATTF